jgi:hypothetical protein
MQKIAQLEQFATRRGLLYRCDAPADGLSDAYVYSHDMQYRYAFARWWAVEGPLVLWVGVNPAKGDTEQRRRPTLERCIRWSRSWGASGLLIGNLFAARHNKPKGLREAPDPVGPHNDEGLRVMTDMANRTVVAWGNDGQRHGRPEQVAGLLSNPVCFGVTGSGAPRHPLYVPSDTPVEPWQPERRRTRGCS